MMQGPYGNVVRDLINLGNGMFPLGLFPEPNFKYKEFQRYFLENFVFKLRDAIRLYEGCFCDQPSDSTDSGEVKTPNSGDSFRSFAKTRQELL